jgi:hypothetical protein
VIFTNTKNLQYNPDYVTTPTDFCLYVLQTK